MEQKQEANEKEKVENSNSMKTWIQDNLRIIISVVIVILIAGGIYSYSKRAEIDSVTDTDQMISQEDSKGIVSEESEENSEVADAQTDIQDKKEVKEQEKTSSVASSQETELSFIETAAAGDSLTTLARKALADYLEKNPDSALTAEHKIYIEDYLRKNVESRRVYVGTSVEFGKDMIKNAITRSHDLTEKQLQNLHKYAVRVPSLS